MAMQLPDPDDDRDESIFAEINITPLTDIILVLLIIFMVTSSAMVEAAREGRFEVELPRAGQGQTGAGEERTLVVTILRDGRVAVGADTIAATDLATVLKERVKTDPQVLIVIDADGEVKHQRVVEVLDRVRAAGFANVGIGVAPDVQ